MALDFNQFAKEANTFMDHYTKALNLGSDKDKASRILSSILHALREIISVNESLQLMSQLPMFLKAVYVNGWSIRKPRRVKNIDDFIELVKFYNGVTSKVDFVSDEMTENYIKTTFIELRQYISLGEFEDIRTELPKELKYIMYQNIMF
jgi:uncharacterized protein (DUF2267 family)